jgi:hypothetical protein
LIGPRIAASSYRLVGYQTSRNPGRPGAGPAMGPPAPYVAVLRQLQGSARRGGRPGAHETDLGPREAVYCSSAWLPSKSSGSRGGWVQSSRRFPRQAFFPPFPTIPPSPVTVAVWSIEQQQTPSRIQAADITSTTGLSRGTTQKGKAHTLHCGAFLRHISGGMTPV